MGSEMCIRDSAYAGLGEVQRADRGRRTRIAPSGFPRKDLAALSYGFFSAEGMTVLIMEL